MKFCGGVISIICGYATAASIYLIISLHSSLFLLRIISIRSTYYLWLCYCRVCFRTIRSLLCAVTCTYAGGSNPGDHIVRNALRSWLDIILSARAVGIPKGCEDHTNGGASTSHTNGTSGTSKITAIIYSHRVWAWNHIE